ncbi:MULTISPECIES: hypothetical protein [unclassified Paenibacillus]|uniref:hypothetical protein n=1 Tax=unclassified Paenibacillus TaxID=185978 RepID=UPI000FE22634|nr:MULTISPECIES: hypothetical protein [unclassified Paenibacillus]MCM3172800.1 hypothetical protein [Paenibacillus sp. MER 99-2]
MSSDPIVKRSELNRQTIPWFKGVWTGVLSGLVLGFLLKAIQSFTGISVYTLLLNIDFVPGLPPILPEFVEFALHLVVSIGIGVFYIWWIQNRPQYAMLKGILIGAVSSLLYIPLSQLSTRVPDLNDTHAILYWVTAHLIYGVTLELCAKGFTKLKKGDPL